MKKRNIVIRYFVLLVLIATFVACASTPKQEGTGEYIDDSVITTKIKSLLAADDFLKSFEITVETYKGIVQLSGNLFGLSVWLNPGCSNRLNFEIRFSSYFTGLLGRRLERGFDRGR